MRGKMYVAMTAFFLMAAGFPVPALAGPPVDPGLTPRWTAITTVAGVAYAPNLPVDVFRYQGRYYCYDGRWYQSPVWGGPWQVIPEPPRIFRQIDAGYFKKVPPGWSRGRKVGWQGEAMPPGQARKGQGGLPPGQARKGPGGLPPGQARKRGY